MFSVLLNTVLMVWLGVGIVLQRLSLAYMLSWFGLLVKFLFPGFVS